MSIPSLSEVLAHIDRNRLETLLIEMIDIYSPSYEEHDLLDYLREWLQENDFPFVQQPVQDDLHNLIIPMGRGEPELFLLGHIDTIPSRHRKDHRAHRVGDQIEGLGAADMKSGVAAMLEAILALRNAGYHSELPAVGLGLLVDEEDGGTGSAAFVRLYRPRMAIIGEPTHMRLCSQHYGYCELALVAHGQRVHSAIPEHGQNAILDMMHLVQELYRLPPPPGLDPKSWSHLNLRELRGENMDFTVPDYCEAYLDMHLHPDVSPEHLKKAVEESIRRYAQDSQRTRIEVEWRMSFSGYHLHPEEQVAMYCQNAMKNLSLPSNLETFRSHSDANLLVEQGIRCLVVGPGALETAHTAHETVSTEELYQAACLYAAVMLEHAQQQASS